MTPLEHRMLRQILTNQFWLLKNFRDKNECDGITLAYLQCRLDNTDVILKQAYNLAREDKAGCDISATVTEKPHSKSA